MPFSRGVLTAVVVVVVVVTTTVLQCNSVTAFFACHICAGAQTCLQRYKQHSFQRTVYACIPRACKLQHMDVCALQCNGFTRAGADHCHHGMMEHSASGHVAGHMLRQSADKLQFVVEQLP